jgi:hypothetical protein
MSIFGKPGKSLGSRKYRRNYTPDRTYAMALIVVAILGK